MDIHESTEPRKYVLRAISLKKIQGIFVELRSIITRTKKIIKMRKITKKDEKKIINMTKIFERLPK